MISINPRSIRFCVRLRDYQREQVRTVPRWREKSPLERLKFSGRAEAENLFSTNNLPESLENPRGDDSGQSAGNWRISVL